MPKNSSFLSPLKRREGTSGGPVYVVFFIPLLRFLLVGWAPSQDIPRYLSEQKDARPLLTSSVTAVKRNEDNVTERMELTVLVTYFFFYRLSSAGVFSFVLNRKREASERARLMVCRTGLGRSVSSGQLTVWILWGFQLFPSGKKTSRFLGEKSKSILGFYQNILIYFFFQPVSWSSEQPSGDAFAVSYPGIMWGSRQGGRRLVDQDSNELTPFLHLIQGIK